MTRRRNRGPAVGLLLVLLRDVALLVACGLAGYAAVQVAPIAAAVAVILVEWWL